MPLDPAIRWLLQRLPNPFAQGRVDNPWDVETIDVESINASAFKACLDLVRDVRQQRQSHGLLLTGAPGTGKTHLLSRLRSRILGEQSALFVYVLPITAPDRFFRHLLHAVAADLLRPAPARPAVSQLEVALARHALGAPQAAVDQCAGYWLEARRLFEAPADLLEHLRGRMAPAFERLGLEPGLGDVALQHAAGIQRAAARSYLTGRGLSEAQLALLGVGEALDEEESATLGLAGLLNLCSEPVVLAFDQIEGLEASVGDDAGLKGFGNGFARLLALAPRNIAAITCLQVAFTQRLQRVLDEATYQGRIAERAASLELLDSSAAAALISARLERAPYLPDVRQYAHQLATARGESFPGDGHRFWPFRADTVHALAAARKSARVLIGECRGYFDAVCEGASVAPAAPGRPVATAGSAASAVSREDALAGLWREEIARRGPGTVDRVDEGVYADGLLKVAEVLLKPGIRAERSRHRDVDLVLVAGGARTGVAVCHAENMTSLARRLGRLRAARPADLDRLVVLRDSRLPVPRTAAATRERLEAFRAEGALVTPGAAAYAALEALRDLLSRSAAGDLEVDDRAVEPGELKRWLAVNPDPALVDLLGGLIGADPEDLQAPPEVLEPLRVALLLPLAELASRSGLDAERLRRLAETPGSGVLLLAGPPPVVFLAPDLLEHS